MPTWRAGLVAVAGIVLLAGELSAQSSFTVKPSVTLAVVSDSNLFAQPADPRSDVVSRMSPAIDAGYRSKRFTLFGAATIDAERFAAHTSLTTPLARSHTALDVRYQPARRLTIDADASFSTTQTPGELNLVSEVALTRAPARRLAVGPALTFQRDAVTKVSLAYAMTEDRLAGAEPTIAHTATAAGERRWSRRDSARLEYVLREFDFGLASPTRSHTVTVGWTRDLTRDASVSLGAGPRVGDGAIVPELSASLAYRATAVDLSLAYARAQTTLIGLAGAADTHSLSATAAYGRRESLRMRLAPGIMQTARAGLQARVYRLSLGASRNVGDALSLDAAYDLTRQRGDVYAARPNEIIIRHVVVVSLAAATPPTRGLK